WYDILKWDMAAGPIGIDDNFFELGGNSLTLIQFTTKVNSLFKLNLPIAEFFKNARIREISKLLLINAYKKDITGPYFVFNDNRPRSIFCFPPGLSYGIAYRDLATYLEDITFYSFNFIENPDRFREYSGIITGLQDKGPYVLLSSSGGGIFVFETAKELERQGYEVSDLIFIDIATDMKARAAGNIADGEKIDENFYNVILNMMAEMGLNHLKDEVINNAKKYSAFVYNMEYNGQVKANIHHILSANRVQDKTTDLAPFTRGQYKTYRGFGNHQDMLMPGHLEANSKIIRDIIREIKDRS
ncbi:MAG TPA: thioesterase domain-containing protein, partial [Candidatus Deferrimicrobium sp.]|nr:thioesterase domain-containing protein [Candidatus Deferrimicrobium sp.]